MPEEAYDLVPHKEVLELKKQIDDIRNKPIESSPEGKNLVDVMTRLSGSMNSMVDLFKEASEHMKTEGGGGNIEKRLKRIEGQIQEVIDENKKIAKGMIAIADMVKGMKAPPRPTLVVPRTPPSPPRPAGPVGGPPSMGSPSGMPSAGPGPMGPPTGPPGAPGAPLGPPPITAPKPAGPPPSPMGAPPPMMGPPAGPPPMAPPAGPPPGGPPGAPPAAAPEKPKKKGFFSFGK